MIEINSLLFVFNHHELYFSPLIPINYPNDIQPFVKPKFQSSITFLHSWSSESHLFQFVFVHEIFLHDKSNSSTIEDPVILVSFDALNKFLTRVGRLIAKELIDIACEISILRKVHCLDCSVIECLIEEFFFKIWVILIFLFFFWLVKIHKSNSGLCCNSEKSWQDCFPVPIIAGNNILTFVLHRWIQAFKELFSFIVNLTLAPKKTKTLHANKRKHLTFLLRIG